MISMCLGSIIWLLVPLLIIADDIIPWVLITMVMLTHHHF